MASSPLASGGRPREPDSRFEYDDAVEDFLRDLPVNEQTGNGLESAAPAKDVDEEVKVKKKRLPVPKLDENLLLSDAGVPKLRRIAKTKLKFKGKGHEFSDIARLLTTYQLWLDDLYPRAKFRDGLTIVEKVGHTKRMQVMRKAWLDETKPNKREPSPERLEDTLMSGGHGDTNGTEHVNNTNQGPNESSMDTTGAEDSHQPDVPDDEDDLDALLAESEQVAASNQPSNPQPRRRGPFEDDDDDPDEDDLDALLAENAVVDSRPTVASQAKPSKPHDDNFEDEEEIMAGMGW